MKTYYNKDDFEYQSGQVHPYKFHSLLYYVMKSFQIVDDEPDPGWSYFVPSFMAFCALIGLIMSIFATYHGICTKDLTDLSQGGAYLIIFLFKMMTLWFAKYKPWEYHALLKAMRDDFHYICTDGDKYRKRYFKHQVMTWKISFLSLILTAGIAVGAVCSSTICLIFYLATHNPEDVEDKRPLLFPLWAPWFDFGDTPYYEVAFVVFNIVPCAYAYGFILYFFIEIMWIRQIMAKANLVTWSIQDVMADIKPAKNKTEEQRNAKVLQKRFREIIIKHVSMYNLMENYANVYKYLSLYKQEAYAPLACFTAFSAVEQKEAGESNRILILVLLCVAAAILTLIPHLMATLLSLNIQSICDACWETPFWNAGPSIRVYLLLIMTRSLRPLPTKAGGFQGPSLATFSQKTMTAYSYFNMLRQLN